jgi:methionyl-tRNA formyltransferase
MSQRGWSSLEYVMTTLGRECVAYVVTARDARVRHDYSEEIMELAGANGIPVYQRARSSAVLPVADARFAIGWRWMLPLDFATPLFVFHDSLLPRYRGFAPLVSALLNAESRVGVTVLLAAERADTGPIIAQDVLTITYPARISDVMTSLCPSYHRLIRIVMRQLTLGDVQTTPQDESCASFSLWRDDEDYKIDWRRDATFLERFVDATGDPYLGASAVALNQVWRILRSRCLPDLRIENRVPGKILRLDEGRPVVVCGQGLLRLDEIVADGTRTPALPWRVLRTRFA